MTSNEQAPSLQLARLEDIIVNTSASISASTGRLLDAIRDFDAAEGWAAAGCRSCVGWLSWRVGVGVVAAREQVRVARALGDLPRTDAALHDGRLSYSKVRAMTRVATPANEAELVELAELSTASQLERICRGYRSCKREITGEEPPQGKQRRIDWRWQDGGLRFSGWLPAEEGELVRQAMMVALDSLRQEAARGSIENASAEAPRGSVENASAEAPGGSAENASAETSGALAHPDSSETLGGSVENASAEAPRRPTENASAETPRESAANAPAEAPRGSKRSASVEARPPGHRPQPDLIDALLAMAETSLVGGLRSASGGARSQVVLHLGPQGCCIDDGPPLDLHAALRLACDAQLLPVSTDEQGRVLDVGRARRSIPLAIRRALTFRDRGCQFPGCTCSRFVDAHHVVHWAQGGETKLSSLMLLCRHHHRLVHEGGYAVQARAGGFEFTDPAGRPIPQVPEVPAVAGPSPLPARRPAVGQGGRWDCGWAVEGLLIDDGLVA